jgi:hypothetical protein
VLTPREWEVLDLLRDGLSNDEIARRLGISSETAKFHVSEILTKLGLANRKEAARWPGRPRQRAGWLPLTPGWLAGLAAVALVILTATLALVSGVFDRSKAGDRQAILPASAIDEAPSGAPDPFLEVCIDNDTWQKPSLDEQAAHINADQRYAPFGDPPRAQFEASFHIGAGPATGRPNPLGKLILFSGLWTLGDSRDLLADLTRRCPDEPNFATHLT